MPECAMQFQPQSRSRVLQSTRQQGLDFSKQLTRRSRLWNEPVTTSDHCVIAHLRVPGNTEDHGVFRRWIRSDLARHREAVHTGEGDVQDHQVGRLATQVVEAFETVADTRDCKPPMLESCGENRADVRIVVDDQYSRAGHRHMVRVEEKAAQNQASAVLESAGSAPVTLGRGQKFQNSAAHLLDGSKQRLALLVNRLPQIPDRIEPLLHFSQPETLRLDSTAFQFLPRAGR
jgi:hypothetical protein